MISIRDRKLGLGLGFGDGEKMKEYESGDYYNGDNNDEFMVDPDIALSYIDEKLQNVLGHFQKDFEGEVSAANLGAKFGGYGTFLHSYPRYPVQQCPQTPQKMHSSSTPRSQNNSQLEGAQTNSLVPSSASLLPSRGSTPATLAPSTLLNDSANDISKRKQKMSSAQCVEESSSGCETDKKFPRASERSLRVRIKVGSVNLSTQRNAEIYNGLGLGMSPSASPDGSPIGSEVSREPFNPLKESPTRILQIMTSFPVPGSLPLSPLSSDLISLSERPEFQGESKCKISQQVSKAKHSGRVKGGKHKSSSKNDLPLELKHQVNKDSQDANGLLPRKGKNVVSLEDERLVGDSRIYNKVKRACSSDIGKVEAGSAELVDRSESEARSLQEDYSASGSTKKPKESRSQVVHSAGFVKESSNMDGSLLHKRRKSESAITKLPKSEVEDFKPQKNFEKVKDTYRDFFGDMELEQDDNGVDSEDILCNNNQEEIQVVEKYASKITSKENTYGKKRVKPFKPKQNPKAALTQTATTGSQPISEAMPGTEEGIPLVQEDWVSCDKCQKWRLLPLGTNPDDLPEKWLCSMLNWLPGMNRCSFSEEETTKALLASHQVPAHADVPRGSSLADASMYDEKKRNGVQDFSVSANKNAPVLNSAKNDLQALVKNSSFNGRKQSPAVNELRSECLSKSTAMEKHRHKQKENKRLFEKHSGEVKRKREAEPGRSSASKKAKEGDGLIHEHNRPLEKVGPTFVSGLPLASGKKLQKNEDHLMRERKRDTNNKSKDPSRKSHVQSTDRKRKVCESPLPQRSDLLEAAGENDGRKEKEARIFKSVGRTSSRKSLDGSKQRRSVEDQHFGPDLGMESLKRDSGSVQPSQATSSSSKVSGSNKNRTFSKEVKGSPVESVSSSPLRFLNKEKSVPMRSLNGKDEFGGVAVFTAGGQRRCSDEEDGHGSDNSGGVRKDEDYVSGPEFQGRDSSHLAGNEVANRRFADGVTDILQNGNQHSLGLQNLNQSVKEEVEIGTQSHTNVSVRKTSTSRSKSKNRTSQTHQDDGELQTANACDEAAEHPPHDEHKLLKNNVQEPVGIRIPLVDEVLVGKGDCTTVAENGKREGQFKYREKKRLGEKVNDNSMHQKQYLQAGRDEVSSIKLLTQELPLSGRGQSETEKRPLHLVSGTQKDAEAKSSVTDAIVGDEILKTSKPTRRPEKQSANHSSKSTNLTPNGRNVQDVKAPSPARRDSSIQAGNIAVKEAKDLKHLADRVKNSGSNAESTSLYFQAALKFLHGASLLESSNSESAKKGEIIMSMQVYSSTAKLCGFCAHEYEKCKDFGAAALAYKLMEVAYMRVIYSSNTNASKDRHELQTALQIIPFGESPSSSVSDIDNLNNPALIDKPLMVKGVGSPQVIGNSIVTARNRPNLTRMLNFAQDVNYAMEASRKSRNAFAAATTNLKESQGREGIDSVKNALDFNFHDVERLLRLVRLAMDAISR